MSSTLMTSPLQAAHAQAAAADPAEPIICSVATPRRSAMSGVYMGEELRTRSSRPGAYDALALPSLIGGEKRDPLAPRHEPKQAPRDDLPLSPLSVAPLKVPKSKAAGPTRAFPTVGKEPPAYRPRPGAAPGKVIDYLKALGGFISQGEVSERFGVTRNAITATFAAAVDRGALAKHVVGGCVGFSLPGWKPPATKPADAPTEPEQLAPSSLVEPLDCDPAEQAALYELGLREAEQALLQRYVATLELRLQIVDANRLLPSLQLIEPPRLTAAA